MNEITGSFRGNIVGLKDPTRAVSGIPFIRRMFGNGPSSHFAAAQQIGRFWIKADIRAGLYEYAP